MTIFQSPKSYTVPCRYAVLCHQSQACIFPCRTNWFDSNHLFQIQTIQQIRLVLFKPWTRAQTIKQNQLVLNHSFQTQTIG